jgi:hypothetical protein
VKNQVRQWVQETLPAGRYYIGLVPSLGPAKLAGTDVGINAAHAELFQRTIMIVVPAAGTPAAVEELGMNVARLLGASAGGPGGSDGI